MTGRYGDRIETGALDSLPGVRCPLSQTRSSPMVLTGMTIRSPNRVASDGECRPTFLGVPQADLITAPSQLDYDPKPADDKIEQYLNHVDHAARPAEIAHETGLSQSYVTTRCKAMWEADRLEREEGGYIIGHNIPGMESPVILSDDREQLLKIVKRVAPEQLPEARGKSLDELRTFIKQKHATATFPLPNRKVSYATE